MKKLLLLAALTLSASVSAQTPCPLDYGFSPPAPRCNIPPPPEEVVHTVPEPSPLLLLAPAALMLVVVGRRRKQA